MGVKYSNNAGTLLTNNITDAATSFDVDDVSEFPAVGGADYMYLTLADNTNIEIIKVTGIAGNTLTCVRGQDGTSGTAFLSGDRCELRFCTIMLTDALSDNLDGRVLSTDGAKLDILSGRNRIINGNMKIAQRGTSIVSPANGDYLLDRWKYISVGTGVVTISQDLSELPAGFNQSIKVDTTTADATLAATDIYAIEQSIEGFHVEDFLLGTASAINVTLSFHVRSTKLGAHYVTLKNSAEDRSYPAVYTVDILNTWEKKTVNFTLDTSGTWLTGINCGLRVVFALGAGSNFEGTAETWNAANNITASGGANLLDDTANTFFLSGIQLEVGDAVTPFEQKTYSEELSICHRYYQRSSTNVYCSPVNTTNFGVTWNFREEMRDTPTVTLLDTTPGVTGVAAGEDLGTASTISFTNSPATNKHAVVFQLTGFTSIPAIGYPCVISTEDAIEADAEL